MTTKTILTCFSYMKCKSFEFNDAYIRSDICGIVVYTLNSIAMKINKVHVITDLSINDFVAKEMYDDFYYWSIDAIKTDKKYREKLRRYKKANSGLKETIEIFCDLSTDNKKPDKKEKLDLKETILGPRAGYKLLVKYSKILDVTPGYILRWLSQFNIPTLCPANILEYVYLFCNLHTVNTRNAYLKTFSSLLVKDQQRDGKDKIFMYWSCHGVKNFREEKMPCILCPDMSLLEVSNIVSPVSPIRCSYITSLIVNLKSSTSVFIIIDCCYAENVIGQQRIIITTRDMPKNIGLM